MKAEEYLEEILKDAFERELEVSENVARTLPFFAASFAVAVPLYGYIASQMPGLELKPLSLMLHLFLAVGAICTVMILWNLFLMVRLREYRIPPKESEQIGWMQALKDHHKGLGLTPATVDKRVTDDLRERMLLEYAAGAEHNRTANLPKLRARASGVVFFVATLVIAFAMIGIIFTSERLLQRPRQDAAHVVRTEAESADPGRRLAPSATEAPSPATGSEVSGRSSRQHRDSSGSEVTQTEKTSTNSAPVPAPAQPASQPPAPPLHQTFKKNEEDGERR